MPGWIFQSYPGVVNNTYREGLEATKLTLDLGQLREIFADVRESDVPVDSDFNPQMVELSPETIRKLAAFVAKEVKI